MKQDSFVLLQLQAIGSGASPVNNPRQAAFEGRVQAMNYSTGVNSSNKEAAEALKAMLVLYYLTYLIVIIKRTQF